MLPTIIFRTMSLKPGQLCGINLSFGQEYVSLNLSGVYPNHTEVEVVKLFKGRFINEIDIKERRKDSN